MHLPNKEIKTLTSEVIPGIGKFPARKCDRYNESRLLWQVYIRMTSRLLWQVLIYELNSYKNYILIINPQKT